MRLSIVNQHKPIEFRGLNAHILQRAIDAPMLITDSFKTFDFGIGLGAGYYFTQNIGVNVRYTAGLSDVPKNNTDDASRNGVFQVGLAYKFK